MLGDLHFLNPWWLVALLPLALLLWLSAAVNSDHNAWRRVIDERLLPVLTLQPRELNRFAARLPLILLGLAWLIAVLALANPTFERKPVPTFSGGVARVVVLDLSKSMLASDLTPNRMARARYKVADILARVKDGTVGLIVFAGDAFTVAPLTQDAATITAMLEALQPEIMPVDGSRPDLALERAGALLEQAGATDGEVVLMTDDAGDERAIAAAEALQAAGHRLVVIGVGTEEGAPVPGMRRAEGPVMTQLDTKALRALARAGDGVYSPLTSDDQDLAAVLRSGDAGRALPAVLTENQAQAWYPLGPWIALALLPLAALAFRRGWLLVTLPWLITPLLISAPTPVLAFGWDDLWLRSDQQSVQALAADDAVRARELAQDPQRRGTAAYRAGDYQAAASDFAAGSAATDHYNRGNALARAGEYEPALAAYEEALALDSAFEDARYNYDQVEALLQQQQEQQQQDQDQDQGESDQNPSGQNQSDQRQDDSSAQHDQSGSSSGNDQDAQSEQAPGEPGEEPSDEPSDDQAGDQVDGQESANDQQQASAGGDSESSDAQQSEQASGNSDDQQTPEDGIEGARDQEAEQQAAEDYRNAAQAAQSDDAGVEQDGEQQAGVGSGQAADQTPEHQEARAAADQWLRRIPDDPAGLLRRKFLYQYKQRVGPEQNVAAGKPW